MKKKRRRYRKGLKGYWFDGTPVYRVPILRKPKLRITKEQKEIYDKKLKIAKKYFKKQK